MGILDRLRRPRAGHAPDAGEIALASELDVPHDLPDEEWMARSRTTATALVARLDGSPEACGEAAKVRYNHQGFGVAIVLYCKALDLMHTQYVVLNMQHRQPSTADTWIVDGFVASVGASLAMHPHAPVDDEVREATHRLRTIASMCERVGASSFLYRNALDQLAIDAPRVRTDDIVG